MLYLTLQLGLLITICGAVTITGTWTQASIGNVALGLVFVVIGVLLEALRFQHAKTVTENQKQLLSMLFAASYVVVGLVLLVLQALAFFGS